MPTTNLSPIRKNTAAATVAARLRESILLGRLVAGALLPPERELAAQFGINRLTLRAGLSQLESRGLIAVLHGSGSRVTDYRERAGIDLVPDLLDTLRGHDSRRYTQLARDVLELRRLVAVETVALAAARHTVDDLRAVTDAVRLQDTRVHDVQAFARGDLDVARSVARAAHNLPIELLLNTIARLPLEHATLLRAMYPAPELQHAHYGTLIELIASRDEARARREMRAALEALDDVTIQRLPRTSRRARSPAPVPLRGSR